MGFVGPTSTSGRRTLREELQLWRSWRDGQSVYLRRKGWDHNRPLFGIIAFAYRQGWIPQSVSYFILIFMLELLGLIPISAFSPSANVLMLDFAAMDGTLGYLCFRLWFSSKLAFATFVPLFLAALALTAILLQASAA